jgi:hypothetical protein
MTARIAAVCPIRLPWNKRDRSRLDRATSRTHLPIAEGRVEIMMSDVVSRDAFESAVDELVELFEHPSPKGPAELSRFAVLLGQVSAYTETTDAPALPLDKLAQFEQHLRDLMSHHPDPGLQDGIGPTLGMDVSHS